MQIHTFLDVIVVVGLITTITGVIVATVFHWKWMAR